MEKELGDLQMQLKLTAGPKRSVLEMLRRKIEDQNNKCCVERARVQKAKQVCCRCHPYALASGKHKLFQIHRAPMHYMAVLASTNNAPLSPLSLPYHHAHPPPPPPPPTVLLHLHASQPQPELSGRTKLEFTRTEPWDGRTVGQNTWGPRLSLGMLNVSRWMVL